MDVLIFKTLTLTPSFTVVPTQTPTATTVPQNGHVVYVYDGDGNLVKSVIGDVVTYYPNGSYELKVSGSSEVITKYYSVGASRIAYRINGATTWLLNDHLGSTVGTVDENGELIGTLKYTAYGELRTGSSTTDYRYTGQREESEIGLYYYVARFYDPALGRFISADTLVPDPSNSLDYDRYTYSRNNPIRYSDSSGHCIDGLTTIACIVLIGGAVLKLIDYGWTAYDAYQSGRVIADPNASQTDKMMAGLNIGLAALFELAEPDDLLPVGVPLDDAARKAVVKSAKEAFEKGGEEGVEKYIRNGLGEHADDVLNRMGINNFADPGLLTDHFLEHGAELGYRTEREYLVGARNLTKGGEGIEMFLRKSDGATLFYNKITNEFATLNKNGTIGTYFTPDLGINYWWDQIGK